MSGSKLGPLVNVCCDVGDNCRSQLQGRAPHKKDHLGDVIIEELKDIPRDGPGDRIEVGTFRTCSDQHWGSVIVLSFYWIPDIFPGVKSVGA